MMNSSGFAQTLVGLPALYLVYCILLKPLIFRVLLKDSLSFNRDLLLI